MDHTSNPGVGIRAIAARIVGLEVEEKVNPKKTQAAAQGYSSVVKVLPSMCKDPSSAPSTAEKRRNEWGRKEERGRGKRRGEEGREGRGGKEENQVCWVAL